MIKKNNKYKNQLNLEIYKLKVNKYQAEAWIYSIYPVKFVLPLFRLPKWANTTTTNSCSKHLCIVFKR